MDSKLQISARWIAEQYKKQQQEEKR